MTVLIDDHVLGRALTETLTDADLDAIDEDKISTTGCWYYRLCHAVRSTRITGSLSAPFANLPADLRDRSVATLLHLPDEIALVSLRDLELTRLFLDPAIDADSGDVFGKILRIAPVPLN